MIDMMGIVDDLIFNGDYGDESLRELLTVSDVEDLWADGTIE